MHRYRILDRDTRSRRELFHFYQTFDNPSYNITVPLAAQPLYDCANARGESFFLLALYAILRAANGVPQLRQRLLNDQVIEFEQIAVMSPVMTDQESFRQIWCEYAPDFPRFARVTREHVRAAQHGTPAPMLDHGDDFFCASCLPWTHFSGMTHGEYHYGQSVPAMTWGKLQNGIIPVAGKFNHALVDGLHVSRFFALLAHSFANPHTLWEPVDTFPTGA
ncbi:CatA-like O-acetyltransferase [Shimwellia pseudoproteus]|uniref:CatA-like O-acetyltransferase, family 1 n=1 Tax=Shimwellia pseudoproteus TaxID=570012 RepID=UPI0018EBA802|nr:CatA-like O-acetyltransferase, family 1 [Shimwellia pseudoproteus]MBJ3815998.1 CatA-like O-acetyltransferase [Shimwellia pseudoproteus]